MKAAHKIFVALAFASFPITVLLLQASKPGAKIENAMRFLTNSARASIHDEFKDIDAQIEKRIQTVKDLNIRILQNKGELLSLQDQQKTVVSELKLLQQKIQSYLERESPVEEQSSSK